MQAPAGLKQDATDQWRGAELPPEIVVVIPSHRQPALLAEAVESVLAQRGRRRIAALVVDDGCPMPETRETTLRLARGNPGQVHLLRRANGDFPPPATPASTSPCAPGPSAAPCSCWTRTTGWVPG